MHVIINIFVRANRPIISISQRQSNWQRAPVKPMRVNVQAIWMAKAPTGNGRLPVVQQHYTWHNDRINTLVITLD